MPGLTTIGIESAFDALLLGQIGLGEHLAHQVAFFDPDAMFTGQHPAQFDTGFQDIGAEGFGLFQLPARLASNRINGCKLPSPAWKTLATRKPW